MAGLDFIEEELDALEGLGRLRALRRLDGAQGARVRLDGRDVTNFSSNDYLGLASSPELVEAGCRAGRSSGSGAGASRLIAGNLDLHERLEGELADWQRAESALVFNSGYQANVGVMTALAGREDLILSDELNHASVIDGCRLSRAEIGVYRHADAGHAEDLLRARGKRARRRFIVTDAVFSMDGDEAPLRDLAAVARKHDAALIVDEAHAVGVFGAEGRGLVAKLGEGLADVRVGTLGKAFGSFGAYVVGQKALRTFLLNRARSFVFTTALPPTVIGASRAALAEVRGEGGEERRKRLWEHVERVARALGNMGILAPGAGESPIFPILVGEEAAAMECCEALVERGLYVQGIRPPTVPRGTSRLRLALTAAHSEKEVQALLGALAELRKAGLLPSADSVQSD